MNNIPLNGIFRLLKKIYLPDLPLGQDIKKPSSLFEKINKKKKEKNKIKNKKEKK
jgi:hypothetical protein